MGLSFSSARRRELKRQSLISDQSLVERGDPKDSY